jgi:hypothetical protein
VACLEELALMTVTPKMATTAVINAVAAMIVVWRILLLRAV